jgi:hypothetical protein
MRRMNIYPNQEWVVRTLRKMNGMKMGFREAVDWENQVCSTIISSIQNAAYHRLQPISTYIEPAAANEGL